MGKKDKMLKKGFCIANFRIKDLGRSDSRKPSILFSNRCYYIYRMKLAYNI